MQPTRSFTDGQGVQWHVSEREVRGGGAREAPRRCLFFEAAHIIRRVCAYPAAWRDLSDEELEELSWGL